MNWNTINTHGEAPEDAFEDLCCHLFEMFGRKEYPGERSSFHRYRGAGGDGGVEAVWKVDCEDASAIQAKWFPYALSDAQKKKVRSSVDSAMRSHPALRDYYVCIPRNLGGPKGDGKKCEEDHWNDLVAYSAERYPGLQLHLWDDHRLTELLAKPDAAGIRGFWFSALALSRKALADAIEMQQAAWMRGRYMADLHTRGRIQERIEIVTMPAARRASLMGELEELLHAVIEVEERLEFFLDLERSLSPDIVQTARELQRAGSPLRRSVELSIESHRADILPNGVDGLLDYMSKARELARKLRAVRYGEPCETSARKLAAYIEARLLDDGWGMRFDAPRYSGKNRLVIVADAGAGKTHALCAEALDLARSDYALPVLARAASIDAGAGWGEVLAAALGIGGNPGEGELFAAFEAAASTLDHEDDATGLYVRGKAVVFVDGIDESAERSRWLELLMAAQEVSARHPRIRFVASSRPAVFFKCDESILADVSRVSCGDVPTEGILDAYLEHYKIELDQAAPIRRFLETPLQVKLFCTLNEGRKLGMGTGMTASVAKLVGAQLDSLEDEVAWKTRRPETMQPVHRVLAQCAKAIGQNGSITRNSLAQLPELSDLVVSGSLDETLRILTEYGALSCFEEKPPEGFLPSVLKYEGGVQAFFDYIVAYNFVRTCADCRTAEMPDYLSGRYETLKYIATMVFEQDGSLMTENPAFEDCVACCSSLLVFNCEVLAGVSSAAAEVAVSEVRDWMTAGSNELLTVVNNLVCVVARVDGHPLGPALLDRRLRSFASPAARDLAWSLPACLELHGCEEGSCWHDGILDERHLRLTQCDSAGGRPLVVAWHLSTLDSARRELCENALAGWASARPEEFFDLFSSMIDVDDPQVLESLVGVAAALSLSPDCPDGVLVALVELLRERLFGGVPFLNAAARHCARIVAERARGRNLIDDAAANACRPPYMSGEDALPLDAVGLQGENNSGPSPMDYDLSRYVVCDPVQNGFFSRWREGLARKRVDAFLERQAERLGVLEMDSAQFCHCAIQGLIKRWGWSEEAYSYVVPGDGGPIAFGVDVAIRRQFDHATHGQRSHVVTVGEKYVWCAKNEVMGYLADRLPYSWFAEDAELLDDYILLDSYRIPFGGDLCPLRGGRKSQFFVPPMLAIQRAEIGNSCELLPDWVEADDDCMFGQLLSKGLFGDTAYPFRTVSLQLFCRAEAWAAQRVVWASACAVPKAMVSAFEEKLTADEAFRSRFFDVGAIRAYVESDCYVTPQEVCASPWRGECGSFFGDVSDDCVDANDVVACMSHVECVASTASKGDTYFDVPSRLFCELLGVRSCDGRRGYAEGGRCVFEYRDSGELGDEVVRQELCADADALWYSMRQKELELCWFVRVLKRDGLAFPDHGGTPGYENDRLYFVKCSESGCEAKLVTQTRRTPKDDAA